MLGKKIIRLAIVVSIFTVCASFSSHSDEANTEVIVISQNGDILAFSSQSNHWVSTSIHTHEKIVSTESQGNIGVVVTTKRILWFSVITDEWSYDFLKKREKIGEIIIEGNVAVIKTNERAIGFSAHTGQWTAVQ